MQTVKFLTVSTSKSDRQYLMVRVFETRKHPILKAEQVIEYNGSFQISGEHPYNDENEWPVKSQKEIEGLRVRPLRRKDGSYICVNVVNKETGEVEETDIRELEVIFPDAE